MLGGADLVGERLVLGAAEPLGLLERQDGLVDVGGLGGRAGLIEVVPLVVQRLDGGAVLVGQDERLGAPAMF